MNEWIIYYREKSLKIAHRQRGYNYNDIENQMLLSMGLRLNNITYTQLSKDGKLY
jgi:hypothetical protein